jgi:hypothetical protein
MDRRTVLAGAAAVAASAALPLPALHNVVPAVVEPRCPHCLPGWWTEEEMAHLAERRRRAKERSAYYRKAFAHLRLYGVPP